MTLDRRGIPHLEIAQNVSWFPEIGVQLRCIELNGDWSSFIEYTIEQCRAEQQSQQRVQLRKPPPDISSNFKDSNAAPTTSA